MTVETLEPDLDGNVYEQSNGLAKSLEVVNQKPIGDKQMGHKAKAKPLAVAMGTVVAVNLLAASAVVRAAENPFSSSDLAGGYLIAEEREGAKAEGKCGEGKCGMRMDDNDDGSVSKEEYMAHKEAKFAAMDQNSDGSVSADEMTKAITEGKCGEGKCGAGLKAQ